MPSVTRCALDLDGCTFAIDEHNRASGSLRYVIETDAAMSPNGIMNAALSVGPNPLPSLWSQYSYLGDSAYCYARFYRYDREASRRTLHYVDVEFRPYENGEWSDFSDVNPLLRPAKLLWTSEIYTARTDFDQAGNPILNKCGIRYEDPVDRQLARGILLVNFNVANFGYTVAHQQTWELAVNSTAWDVHGDASLVIPARAAWCRKYDSQPLRSEGTSRYFAEKYEIAIAHSGETFDRRIKEQGFQHWKKTGGTYVDDADDNHKFFPDVAAGEAPYAEPILLASDGTRLADGETTVYTDWQLDKQANFNSAPFMPLAFS